MWAVRAVLITVIVIAVVAFAIHNVGEYQKVDVNLIWKSYHQVALVEVVFWSFVAGIAVSLVMFVSVYIRLSMAGRAMRKQVRALEAELAVLRNRPIEESAQVLDEDVPGRRDLTSPFDERE
ncbi:MAG TPA: LapA family protein [candidate division Zixibacteria bacterium]|nr:LapA family protein [candidate division Zixibacteria bacterium]MDD4917192.1 LapA family protein [candidate division Zixibacteria bacterium]MDM7971658.1 LapA family protein [candidate division Zixibacteria bacterium]HOD65834.1 LapA family protein [candidate division Zixibacteria bacterium]HOZ09090.1 LapA family protein [candidate division Zixibacteria bacterium]